MESAGYSCDHEAWHGDRSGQVSALSVSCVSDRRGEWQPGEALPTVAAFSELAV